MKHHRLLDFIKPEKYEIIVKPDLKKFVFEGEERIFLNIEKPVREITLHSKELKIFKVNYKVSNLQFLVKSIKYNKQAETVTLVFHKQIPKSKGELGLKFTGILNNQMRGFYRSQYEYAGQTKHIATTQFEATDARRAFPCFDEPAKKAVFDVTIVVPKNLTAISNTIETSVLEHKGGFKAVKFAPSPKMSTYLLAFIVGDFEFIEGKTKRGVVVRIFVTQGKKHQAKFALDTAIKVLDFYEKYFNINYPLPILGMIAIPDFSHGAMENWGAVTYRESALLVDNENSSASNKQWVALVIAHELAHQWFGNLVTMEWWTDLWLNEGFASYIEYLAVDKIFPNWDIWTQFAFSDLEVALNLDSLNSTHPIEVKVNHPDEIGEIFDEVSYSKGASVIRMLANYLGENDFRKGLQFYLKKHSYKNAKTEDLWQALEKISKKPVKSLMQNWTKKAGYPYIKVVEKVNSYELIQKRFFISALENRNNKDNTIWQIPVSIKQDNNSTTFLQKTKKINIKKENHTLIKLNFKETTPLRVDYPAQMLVSFKKFIENKKLLPLDRLGLIRDAFAMAEAGNLPTASALNFSLAYLKENNYTVWLELVSGIETIKNLLPNEEIVKKYNIFCSKLYNNIIKAVGLKAKKNEPHTLALLRSLVLNVGGSSGNKMIINFAKKEFNLFINNKKSISANLRSVIYSLVAENGSFAEHKYLINLYKKETLHEEKNRIGRALGKFKDQKLLVQTLKFSLSKFVRIQDTAGFFNVVWGNPLGQKVAFEFTKTYWDTLLSRYPSSGHMLSRFIKPMSVLNTKEDLNKVKEFFKTHKASGVNRVIMQVYEKINSNIDWVNRDMLGIKNWLNKNF